MPDHSNNHHAEADELLEPYLDGLLTARERDRFERILADRNDLKEQVAQQEVLDDSLRRLMEPPSSESLRPSSLVESHGRGEAAPRAMQRVTRLSGLPIVIRRMGIAAVLAGGVFGFWLIWQATWSTSMERSPYDMAWREVQAIYADEVAGGMKPDWICENDAEFIAAFRDRFGQGLRLGPLPAGVEVLGLDYAHSLTKHTLLLLALVDDRPAIVFIDRATPILTPSLPDGSGLYLHQRQIGPLILFELSPLEESRLLEVFSITDGDE